MNKIGIAILAISRILSCNGLALHKIKVRGFPNHIEYYVLPPTTYEGQTIIFTTYQDFAPKVIKEVCSVMDINCIENKDLGDIYRIGGESHAIAKLYQERR